ncbi:MAG: hypothetical protein QOI20_458 [Acidimicrobiaceae bacterium]|jgi:hypothetical protein|nr:hypothetical protein [Acidimicrobiaceae bacterium]
MKKRAASLILALALALGTTACAGPKRPFELGLKEVPSDLLLGRQTQPALPLPAQMPPSTFLVSGFSAPTPTPPSVLPPPIPEPVPPLPPSGCPPADPLAPARLATALDITRPPAPATYPYRTSGFVIAGQSRTLPPVATHKVDNVHENGPGDFTFDVTVDQAESTPTTTTYHVVPRTSVVVAPGLYISRVVSGSGPLNDFSPRPELLLLPFPALPGTAFTAAGTDGVTAIKYEGTVQTTERIDACGANVDGTRVVLANGQATSARNQGGSQVAEEFNAEYVIATQYGGLSLRDLFQASTPGSTDVYGRELRGLINAEPIEPRP